MVSIEGTEGSCGATGSITRSMQSLQEMSATVKSGVTNSKFQVALTLLPARFPLTLWPAYEEPYPWH